MPSCSPLYATRARSGRRAAFMNENGKMRHALSEVSEQTRLRGELIRARAEWIDQARIRLWERMDRLRRMQAEAGLVPCGVGAPQVSIDLAPEALAALSPPADAPADPPVVAEAAGD